MNAAIIIPAYDPKKNLIQLVDRVWELENQVIVVDDGSNAKSQELFNELSEKAIVIHHEKNKGKGAAIKTALKYIKENIWDCGVIGVMDADGQHLPDDMEKLVTKAKYRDKTMILGVRKIGKNMPLKSRLGNSITKIVFYFLNGVKISDTQTGLRAFSEKMVDTMLQIDGIRYEYETNVLCYCAKNKIPIIEVPVKTIYHDIKNTCSHFRVFKDSVRIYKDIIRFSLSSLSSFLLDYFCFCLFLLLFPAGAVGVIIANVFARIISGIYNYLLNCNFVFCNKAKLHTVIQYLTLAIVILLLNSIILQLYNQVFHIAAYKAKLLTEISLFIISFIVQNKLIFKKSFRME